MWPLQEMGRDGWMIMTFTSRFISSSNEFISNSCDDRNEKFHYQILFCVSHSCDFRSELILQKHFHIRSDETRKIPYGHTDTTTFQVTHSLSACSLSEIINNGLFFVMTWHAAVCFGQSGKGKIWVKKYFKANMVDRMHIQNKRIHKKSTGCTHTEICLRTRSPWEPCEQQTGHIVQRQNMTAPSTVSYPQKKHLLSKWKDCSRESQHMWCTFLKNIF